MPLSHEPGRDEQLVRYLLGLLSDEDTERLDELSIADDEVAWRLRAVEDELVDSYVSGTLTGEMLERFESFYLSSPRRRQRVSFARSFRRSVDRAAERSDTDAGCEATESLAPEQGRSQIVPRSKPVWLLATAAALFLVCGALLFQTARLRNGLNEAQTQRQALDRRAHQREQQLNNQHAANAEAVKELERGRASLAELVQQPAATQPDRPGGSSQAVTTMALVLLPQTRAIGPIATLAVPGGTERVRFDLRLESNDFPRYQVALKDPATNQIVWRSGQITPKSAGGEPTVPVVVPARALKPQHYSFELAGFRRAGGAEVVSSYSVRISRP